MYCETATSTCWPSHSMILVSGSSVTSVRNGWSSTRPRSRTDACCETGKSGLVMFVGSENVGIVEVDALALGSERKVAG